MELRVVEVLNVAPSRLLQSLAEVLDQTRGGQYVDMIGHQHVCVDSQPLLFSGFLKAFIVKMGV